MAGIIFMGTPDYAADILRTVYSPDDTYLVVTKPDMPQGRKQIMTPSAVAAWAESQGIPTLKPAHLAEIRGTVKEFRPDYILTAAFGRILRDWLLELPRFGGYNLHASLLPRWRGPNPIAWAIRAQDSHTGVTLMKMDAGIDTGPIVSRTDLAIDPAETVATLTRRLSWAAAQLWQEARQSFGDGPFPTTVQPTSGVTLAPKFQLEDAHLDFSQPASVVSAQARSVSPDPGSWAMWGGLRIKVLDIRIIAKSGADKPGRVLPCGQEWAVACDPGYVAIGSIQPAGGRVMRPGDFMRGQRQGPGRLQ